MIAKNAILRKHFEKYGFDDEFFKTYETFTDDELQNIGELCDRLHSVKLSNQKMVIYTDFDVDGIMSSIIAYAGLSELGFNVSLFKPSPSDGYGFRPKDVDDIINTYPDAAVIFTGDVGIACNEAIDYAKSKGLSVFVTDHHIGTEPCSADITVNPNQLGETYSHNYICGSYVIYYVLEHYCKKYCEPVVLADIYRLQMFAGIATISDIMPLIYENRQLVRNSVSLMRYFYNYQLNSDNTIAPPVYSAPYMQAFTGMKKLLDYFTDLRKIKKTEDIDEQFYGFYLVPFLNSCKRMDGNMNGIYDIFFSPYVYPAEDFPNMSCVINGIKYIECLSDRRKELTTEYFALLCDEKQQGITDDSKYMQCEVYITDAPAGLLGLLGSKLMNMSGLPTLVVNRNEDGSYTGSGRNPSWLDFAVQLREHGINITCCGHKEAFGVHIADEQALRDYEAFFINMIMPEYVARSMGEQVSTNISIAHKGCCECDFISDNILIKEYMDEMKLFKPYGHHFPEPHFEYYIKLDSDYVQEKMFGRENEHIKLITDEGLEILLFGFALDFEMIKCANKGKDYILVCSGVFRYDDFDNLEYDTVNFVASDITAKVI